MFSQQWHTKKPFVNGATIQADEEVFPDLQAAAVRWPMVDDGGGSSAETEGRIPRDINNEHASIAVAKNHSIAPDTCTQKTGK